MTWTCDSPVLAITLYTKAASATLVESTPGVPKVQAISTQPSLGSLCAVGMRPTTPHMAAGILMEPPPSVPARTKRMLTTTRRLWCMVLDTACTAWCWKQGENTERV